MPARAEVPETNATVITGGEEQTAIAAEGEGRRSASVIVAADDFPIVRVADGYVAIGKARGEQLAVGTEGGLASGGISQFPLPALSR